MLSRLIVVFDTIHKKSVMEWKRYTQSISNVDQMTPKLGAKTNETSRTRYVTKAQLHDLETSVHIYLKGPTTLLSSSIHFRSNTFVVLRPVISDCAFVFIDINRVIFLHTNV